MRIRTIGHIALAIGFSLIIGLGVRWLNSEQTCSETALDAVLAGGDLVLPDKCVIATSATKIVTGDVRIVSETWAGISGMGTHRVLEVAEGASLHLENLLIVDGFVTAQRQQIGGAGLSNRGTLNLHHTQISSNRAENVMGAGIYNAPTGILNMRESHIERNFSDGGSGAGLYNDGRATIYRSSIAHNTIYSRHEQRVSAEFGAGIYNAGTLTMRESDINDNNAPNAGGIFNAGNMTLEDGAILHNTTRTTVGCTGDGAGIFNAGEATLIRTTIRGNRAGKWAGGIDNQGMMTIMDSRIEENAACVGGGGIFNAFEQADLTIRNSIIANNRSDTEPERNNGLYNLISIGDTPGTVHAANNYWGSSDGPGGEGPGNGDGISGIATSSYSPWLTQPPDWAR